MITIASAGSGTATRPAMGTRPHPELFAVLRGSRTPGGTVWLLLLPAR